MSFLLRMLASELDEPIVAGGGLEPKRVRSEKQKVTSER
jgi:hypothetical protein